MSEATFPAETTPQGSAIEEMVFLDPPVAEWRKDLEGLLATGSLTGSFSWLGHRIVLRTLNTHEELLVALLIADWEQTVAGPKAYATAMVSLAVDFIDDRPMPSPLGETGRNHQWALERFRYAQRWYPFTIDAMYDAYLKLEARVKEVIDQLGKSLAPAAGSPPGPSTSSAPPIAGDGLPGPASP